MVFSAENLLRELDQPEIINWVPELKNRQEAYAFLLEEVRGDQLNLMQFLNALHALFQLAFPENVDRTLRTFVELSLHPNVLIRSEAIKLAIGIVRVSRNVSDPVRFSAAQEATLREAIAKELRAPVEDLLTEWLEVSTSDSSHEGANRADRTQKDAVWELSELDALYAQFLERGLMLLRLAIWSGDQVWMKAEIDLLHNVPGLLGEENIERHRYFWFQERELYVDRLTSHGAEKPLSYMRTYYEPIWEEMEPLMLDRIKRPS